MALSRRGFIRVATLAAAAGVLQACAAPGAAPAPIAPPPATVAAPTLPPKPTQAALPKLTVSYGAPVGSFAALWMAKAINAFDKYGLTVDVQYNEMMQERLRDGVLRAMSTSRS